MNFKTPEGRKKKEEMRAQARAMGLADEIPDSGEEDEDIGDTGVTKGRLSRSCVCAPKRVRARACV